MEVMMIKLLVIGGEDTLRRVRAAIRPEQDELDIAGEGRDGYDALRLAENYQPDIMLIDEYLPMLNCADAVSLIKQRAPHTRILILTQGQVRPWEMSLENQLVLRAIRNGAAGFFQKQVETDNFIRGIKLIHRGLCLMSPEITAKAFGMTAKKPPMARQNSRPLGPSVYFTHQEFCIIAHISRGDPTRKIAQSLQRQEGTIRNQITGLLQKTGLRNRTQLAIYAHNHGINGED
jgi:DNA-binding NarL/FixJ family response regulator